MLRETLVIQRPIGVRKTERFSSNLVTKSLRSSPWLLLLLALASWSGCALFSTGQYADTHNPLPPMVGPRDAIELEVFIVDRAVGDPLIGEGMWGSLHDLTTITPELRNRLADCGMRVAMSPARPPRSIQALLSLSSNSDPTRSTSYHRIVVPAGQPTYIPITILPPQAEVDLPSESGLQRKTLTNGNCMLQVRADKVADGWAHLEVEPVIHHGEEMLRPKATPEDWVFEQGQKMISLYEDRFTVELNDGELIVLGFTGSPEHSLGENYFRGEWDGIRIERHVIIRLRGMHHVNPVRAQ